MSATSGLSSLQRFADFDPDTSSWRTCATTFPWGSTSSPLTFPAWGIGTPGALYALPMSALATNGRASSSLLPMPMIGYTGTSVEDYLDRKVTSGGGRTVNDLGLAVRTLPTPTARLGDESGRGADPDRYRGPKSMGGRRSNLDDMVAATMAGRFLPTPTSMDAHSSGSCSSAGGKGHGLTITDVVARGVTTDPRSRATNESSAGQLPLLPTTEDG